MIKELEVVDSGASYCMYGTMGHSPQRQHCVCLDASARQTLVRRLKTAQ
ncbi:hypothetical protein GBAR_LOCUS6949 [Geodia barretti]|uniref:Uncharacterized protein n=1 Tax=Geodia barretti TaxID=519541 RepID=A0AA35RFK8_GEOBA|nr:hypothetical protein GBAR_LOCUS6949 [Geodia barretti]